MSQRHGLWFYRSNSLMLFSSPLHVHFSTIKLLLKGLVFKKLLAKLSSIFDSELETFKSAVTHLQFQFLIVLQLYLWAYFFEQYKTIRKKIHWFINIFSYKKSPFYVILRLYKPSPRFRPVICFSFNLHKPKWINNFGFCIIPGFPKV